ncbi:hypothetical protein [Oscillibacter sp.]|jgi:hypothetical protein|uniref:hypothetical protein n=1 Tax=Oscillibacter sp. TaxID=1945593 RepID=UPI0025E2EB3D|nr:hypothetical protein [Oscillibacter sp.]
MPNGESFFTNQGDLMRPCFVHGKENQRRAAEKGLPFGRFDIFQTGPKNFSKNPDNHTRYGKAKTAPVPEPSKSMT